MLLDQFVFPLLIVRHPSLPRQLGIVGKEPELRLLSCKDMDVIRKILRTDKAFKSVCNKVFCYLHVTGEGSRGCEALVGKTPDTIRNSGAGGMEDAGKVSDARAGDEVGEDSVVTDVAMCPVVDAKGPG